MVNESKKQKKKLKKGKFVSSNKKITLLILIVVISIIASGFYLASLKQTVVVEEEVVTAITDDPDESKESADNFNWNGAPDEPKKINVDKLSVDAYVQKMGVNAKNEIAVPSNIHLGGWFVDSVKPGQKGLSIVAGHVSGPTADGVFKNLNTLSEGDTFKIEKGNGEILNYKVISTITTKWEDSASYLFSQDPKVKSQVNLITCGGSYDDANQRFVDRVIVGGELVE